jgi:hypothetical protein
LHQQQTQGTNAKLLQLSYFSQLHLTAKQPGYDQAFLELIALIIRD